MLMSVLLLAHLLGLALGLGGATVKLTLLLRTRADQAALPAFLAVARPVTRLLVLGLVLLTLSGIGWLLLGYPFTTKVIVKLALVAAMWVVGPVIDNVVEPEFRRLAPGAGEPASPGFLRARQRYLVLESSATGLFYLIVGIWILT